MVQFHPGGLHYGTERYMKQRIINMLRTQAEAEREKALLSLELLMNHPVGIGDHSTGDFYKNAEEALQMLVDAEDKLETLDKYFSE
jgi:hypothetical protein